MNPSSTINNNRLYNLLRLFIPTWRNDSNVLRSNWKNELRYHKKAMPIIILGLAAVISFYLTEHIVGGIVCGMLALTSLYIWLKLCQVHIEVSPQTLSLQICKTKATYSWSRIEKVLIFEDRMEIKMAGIKIPVVIPAYTSQSDKLAGRIEEICLARKIQIL